MAHLEFFFDCSSPWTYLAFSRIHDVLAETGAGVTWRPILVGGVFNAVNRGLYEQRARMAGALAGAVSGDAGDGAGRKARYYLKDLADWARFCGIRIGQPPIRVEIHSQIAGVDFKTCFPNAKCCQIQGVDIPFISLDDLRQNKRAAGRTKDLADLEALPEKPTGQ